VKLHPVSVKSSDESLTSSVDILYNELSRLLRDDSVENEVLIDCIDVRHTHSLLVLLHTN